MYPQSWCRKTCRDKAKFAGMLQPKILILLITEIALFRDCRGCCSLYVVYALLEIDEEARIRLPLGGMPKHCWHQGSVPYWNSSGSCCFYWQQRYLSIVEIRVEARGSVSPRLPLFSHPSLFSGTAKWHAYILQSPNALHQIGRHQKRTALSKGFI